MNYFYRQLRVSLFVGLVCAAATAWAGKATRTLDLYWVDSEGGGSTLIVTPDGESVLIDAGNPGARDAGRIFAAAKSAGLTRIDHFLLTHFHIDHFGGLPELAALIPIGTIYDKGIPEGDADGRKGSSFPLLIKPYRELSVTDRVTLKPGMVIPLRNLKDGPKLELTCLGANQLFVTPAPGATPNALLQEVAAKPVDTSDNANSAVFVLQFGGFRFFDGGDLSWNVEQKLVSPINLVGTVDVYQVQHHGLDQSNHPNLVRSLAPTVAVMNNGPKKGNGPGTFATLASIPSLKAVYQSHRTVLSGAGNTDADAIANHDEQCAGNIIALSVAPDAKLYELSIPSSNHRRSFETKVP